MACILPVKHRGDTGFTLVEVLVIAPIVMISITIIVAVIITITGEVMRTQGTNTVVYKMQDSLNQIEDDARMATEFVGTSYTPASPQGATATAGNVDGSLAFSTSAAVNPAKLIIRTVATDQSPLSPTRAIKLKSLDGCTSWAPGPIPYTIDSVYFLKPKADGSQSLWRRMLFGTNAAAGWYCGSEPWQVRSCSPGYTDTAVCKAEDLELLDNVTSVTVSYSKSDGSSSGSPSSDAIAIKVTVETTDTVAGRTSVNSASINAKR